MAIRQVPLWLVLALILGIAAFLRLAGLGYESLWIDEVLTYRVSQAPLLKIPLEAAVVDGKPPLYYCPIRLATAHATDGSEFRGWQLLYPVS